MAKEARRQEEEHSGTVILTRDQEREADERKDRERLKEEKVEYNPEEISKLMAEREKLRVEHESASAEAYRTYREKANEIDQKLGAAGANAANPPSGPQPSNETFEDGTPRSRLSVR